MAWRLRFHHHRFGAGSGTLAHDLALSEKKILLIERGPFVRREKIEIRAQSMPKVNTTKELWRNVDGSEHYPHANYYLSDDKKMTAAIA